MLVDIIKSLFSSDTKFGVYHRNGWGFLALGYATCYLVSPYVSVPILAAAGYNLTQTFRHRSELLNEACERYIHNAIEKKDENP